MTKQRLTSDRLYPVYGPYSHAVRAGDMIFLHGTIGFDVQGRLPGSTPGRTDMVGQCRQTLDNLSTALELLGDAPRCGESACLSAQSLPSQPGGATLFR